MDRLYLKHTLTSIWTLMLPHSPYFNALLAEACLAAIAFDRVFKDHEADATKQVFVHFFPFF
jgi:hypothetical protein